MDRRIKIISAFVIPVLLIGTYFIVTTLQSDEDAQIDQEGPVIVFPLTKEELQTVTISRNDDRVTIENENTRWQVKNDVPFQLQQSKIDTVVDTVVSLPAQRVISENPKELSSYGLEAPRAEITLRTKKGTETTGYIGNRTPQGDSYYFKKKDEPTVFTVAGYFVSRFNVGIDDIRTRLLAEVDPQEITYLRVEAEHTIEISSISEEDNLSYFLSTLKMTEPYKNRQEIDTHAYSEYLEKVPASLSAVSFVEEEPESLEKFGLINPKVKLQLRDRQGGFTLLLGNKKDEREVYASLVEHPRVFTVGLNSLGFLATKPFELISKFALIINIDMVERLTFGTPLTMHTMSIERGQREGDTEAGDEEETIYRFHNEIVEEEPFKDLYQKVIGLMIDAPRSDPDYSGESTKGKDPVLSVVYDLNESPHKLAIELYPYNADFYALYRQNVSEFLIAKEQVEALLQSAEQFPDIEE